MISNFTFQFRRPRAIYTVPGIVDLQLCLSLTLDIIINIACTAGRLSVQYDTVTQYLLVSVKSDVSIVAAPWPAFLF